ncbi:uncharacterized protein LOC127715063 isoform X2 [Mytilus californianus]|uniref:uncharacterized protein LOC127715063 isoform X2 n=1 Tax=Mytilus californianus TaxID=6549 RepID=UPI002247A103|nr:uncharacterized protein LOC127715063 isoform X2 [Mytilus californianus]
MTDHITQNVSKELYCYMCQNIVGTEEHVKQIRLFNAARDSLLIDEYQTSGSFGEGLMMRGSDLDIMSVRRNIEVYDVKPRLNQHTTYLSIDTDDVKPGFTQLRLEVCRSQNVFANCVQFADQVNNVAASMQFFYMEQNQLHVSNITKITNSHLFQASNFCFRLGFNAKKISLSSSLKRIIQKAVSVDKSSIKYVYTYYMSTLCAFCAQSIPIDSAYRNNKYRYRQYKSCLCTLLQNIYHDAVSGWLMIASFFYKTKQYSKSLRIIMYSLSKCTVEKLFRFMKMSDSHYGLLKLKLFQKKSIVNLWKLILVDNIKFDKSSLLIPDELLKEVEGREFVVPSTAYAYFLNVLCHYHLNNVRKCRDILQDLQCVIDEKYLMKNLSMIAVSYNLLGVALQILGDTESARQAFLQSVELNKYPSRIFAVKRLLLMS